MAVCLQPQLSEGSKNSPGVSVCPVFPYKDESDDFQTFYMLELKPQVSLSCLKGEKIVSGIENKLLHFI